MATSEVQKSVDRAHTVFIQLLKQIPPAERDKHLARHLEDIQHATDALLGALTGDKAPTSLRKPAQEAIEAARTPLPLDEDASTVPGAIRCVLACEKDGLSPRAIVAGVLLLRSGTSDSSVHGALSQMRKRGELSRVGFHKNYRYSLVSSFGTNGATSATNTVLTDSDPPRGGETH